MSQQQLSKFVSPVTQPLDDMHTHLSSLSAAYRDVNTKLRTHVDSLTAGTQGFQGSGANTFSSLVDYYTGAVEKHCQGLDNGASAAKSCSTQVTTAVTTASSSNLDTTIVTHVLSQLTLDDIILHGGSAIDPIMQDLQNTCKQMQNTWSDLQKTWADEDKTKNDSDAANNQALNDLFSFNFGGLWNDNVRIWNDTMQTFKDWGSEASDYVQLGGESLHVLWDAIQLAWQILVQWADDISQAVKNCLSAVGAIVTKATQDINTFISGIVKDEQRLMDDLKKGDYTDALNEILNDSINPELKMMGLQQISPEQIQEVIPPGLWAWLQSLPWWAWAVAIAAIAAIVVGIFVARMFAIQAALSSRGITATKGQIWSLLWQGFSNKDIEWIVQVANLKDSEGVGFQRRPGSRWSRGHTLTHVGLSDASMENTIIGGKRTQTSFPNNQTAQYAVNFAIANSPILQQWILHGTPNSEVWTNPKVCKPWPTNFGKGYKRNPTPPPIAIKIGPLRCVRVGLFRDASGKIHVFDAYPVE